jgi:hypothetical protein
MKLTRRDFGFGAAALAALAAGAFGYRHIFGPWYAPTPYDDLLHQIVDREPAALLGRTVVKTMPRLDVAALAARLRRPGFALSRRARGDAAAGRVVEAGGWVVPETLALYAMLAAQFG